MGTGNFLIGRSKKAEGRSRADFVGPLSYLPTFLLAYCFLVFFLAVLDAFIQRFFDRA